MGHFMDDQEIEGHAKTQTTGKPTKAMQIVTKRDMFDAEAILDVIANAEDDTPIRDFIHDVAQAIADGRRP